eukprot:348286-Prymnesium_polylepis.1
MSGHDGHRLEADLSTVSALVFIILAPRAGAVHFVRVLAINGRVTHRASKRSAASDAGSASGQSCRAAGRLLAATSQ